MSSKGTVCVRCQLCHSVTAQAPLPTEVLSSRSRNVPPPWRWRNQPCSWSTGTTLIRRILQKLSGRKAGEMMKPSQASERKMSISCPATSPPVPQSWGERRAASVDPADLGQASALLARDAGDMGEIPMRSRRREALDRLVERQAGQVDIEVRGERGEADERIDQRVVSVAFLRGLMPGCRGR